MTCDCSFDPSFGFTSIGYCPLHGAAPDLLKALEKATKAFDAAISLTPTGPARDRLCDMNIEAHVAIAKARGPRPDSQ